MNSILVLLTVTSLVAASNYEILIEEPEGETDIVINQLEQQEDRIPIRATRVQGSKMRLCGRRLVGFVFATCGSCEPGYTGDISTLCCSRQCDAQDIINVCCPNAFRR